MGMKRLADCRSIYIGGPISHGGTLPPDEIERNLWRFFDMEHKLQVLGLSVFNPARLPKHNRHGERAGQEDYLEQCVWMVMQAEGMVVLDGWQQSPGTTCEVLIAQSTGKPVFGEDFKPSRFTLTITIERGDREWAY